MKNIFGMILLVRGPLRLFSCSRPIHRAMVKPDKSGNYSFVTSALLLLIVAGMFVFGGNLFAQEVSNMDSKKVIKSDQEWRQSLTPEQYEVCRLKGTERPFSGAYYASKEKAQYICAACGNPLFSSETKFDSGTGWPSFWAPMGKDNVRTEEDRAHGLTRVEVLCNHCDAHLGHVFEDGPAPTNQRYCINSVSLKQIKSAPEK